MAAKISSFPRGTKKREQRQAGHYRHEKVQAKSRRLAGEADGAKHPDDAEGGGGKADKQVSRSMDRHIEKIGGRGGRQQCGETDTVAGKGEEKVQKKYSENTITQKRVSGVTSR